jgi:hypothetical protein
MTDMSARLGLPYLYAGQAAKELMHNEALALLDLAVQPAVEAVGVDVPPAGPAEGQAWIVGAAPAGAWAGRAHALAGWTGGGWRFVAATEGASVWNKEAGVAAQFVSGEWHLGDMRARRVLVDGDPVVGARQPAIADPAGGSVADAEARAAVTAVLEALRTHGLVAR